MNVTTYVLDEKIVRPRNNAGDTTSHEVRDFHHMTTVFIWIFPMQSITTIIVYLFGVDTIITMNGIVATIINYSSS